MKYFRNETLKRILVVFLTTLSMVVFSGCDGTKETPDNPDGTPINVSGIILENSVSAKKGGDVTLKVVGSHGPEEGDVIVLMNTAESFDNQIKSIDKGSFTFTLDPKVTTGRYEMLVRRNSRTKIVGYINIDIIFDVADIEPTGDNNVYGVVHCDGEGLADVVVSDGVEVVKTDKDGVYQFKSAKKWGYVFISIPKGYEVGSEGVLPQFHATLTEKADKAERHDFNLVKVNQEKYRVYFLGDMHLADRTNDLNQFDNCMKEVKADIMDDDVKSYVITLGDMTWDLYWYSRKYYFPQYLKSVNYYFKNAAKQVQFFHTIGNHDHDMCKDGDFNTVIEYVKDIAPTYYSFNIGDVHYIVLDDILCTNVGGAASAKPERSYYSEVTDEQLKWLAKDLSFVSKTTPVIVTSHAPVYAKETVKNVNAVTTYYLNNSETLISKFKGYNVDFVTGHTHVLYNVDKTSEGIYEHNAGAVCASWWWSGYLTPGIHICTDGAPGGYSVWDITGTDKKWRYKGTGRDENEQFRSYDLNNVWFTVEKDAPKVPAALKSDFEKYTDAYPKNSKNEVLINIWNWNPKWQIEIKENGKTLTSTRVKGYDPLHIAALTAKRFNNSAIKEVPAFTTTVNYHMFKVKASSATSTIDIKVTDEFGNVYTETMKRPKTFSTEAYK